MPEAWLSGPVAGIDPYLLPVAHALLQVREDVTAALADLTPAQMAERPGGSASLAFHAAHLAGATDRLFTYARGEALTQPQQDALKAERAAAIVDAGALVRDVSETVARALEQLRATPRERLLDERRVGRAGLPSNVLGLLFHAAEHATRHAGQIITTAKVVKGAVG